MSEFKALPENKYYKPEWFDPDVEPNIGDFVENCQYMPCLVLDKRYEELDEVVIELHVKSNFDGNREAYERAKDARESKPYGKNGDYELLVLGTKKYEIVCCSITHCAPLKIKKEYISQYLMTMPYQRYVIEHWDTLIQNEDFKGWWGDNYHKYKAIIEQSDDLMATLGYDLESEETDNNA